MQKILEMASSLNKAETNGIAPMANPHDAKQILRDDICRDVKQRESFFSSRAPGRRWIFSSTQSCGIKLQNETLTEQIKGIRDKKYSSFELAESLLDRIKDKSNLNCFISINDNILEEAKAADKELERGSDKPSWEFQSPTKIYSANMRLRQQLAHEC